MCASTANDGMPRNKKAPTNGASHLFTFTVEALYYKRWVARRVMLPEHCVVLPIEVF